MKLLNPLVIIRTLSTILLIETISFLPPLIVAVIYREDPVPFALSAFITGIIYLILRFESRKAHIDKASQRDTYIIVTSAWILFSVFGSLPYILGGSVPSFTNAFFESTSGFTTTGASILSDVESLPFSIIFWRSFTHWIGGLGIIVLVIMILPSLNVTGYQLFSLESSMKEKIHPRIKGVGLRVSMIYLGLTIAEIVFLLPGDMDLFDSICHSFGTIATGGFSTKNTGMLFYSPYSQYVVMIFMFLAGISQVVYYYLLKRNFKKVRHNEELRFYLLVTLLAGLFATLIIKFSSFKSFEEAFREGWFQVISIITCTGFANADYLLWPSAGMLLIFLLMFAGGSTGSTSGGIKMARHLIVFKNIKRILSRITHPNAFIPVRLNYRNVDEKINASILSFIVIYLFVFLLGTIILALAGSDILTSAGSVASCLAGIGPGFGDTGPMSNYAAMPEMSKIFLSLIMITGRLEIMTVLILFSRSFWKL